MTAEEAMAEIWGTVCPDCGPHDYEFVVRHVTRPGVVVRDACPCPAHPADRGILTVDGVAGIVSDLLYVDRATADAFATMLADERGAPEGG